MGTVGLHCPHLSGLNFSTNCVFSPFKNFFFPPYSLKKPKLGVWGGVEMRTHPFNFCSRFGPPHVPVLDLVPDIVICSVVWHESCRCGNNVPACLKVVLLFNFLSVGCIYWFVFWNTVQCNTVVFTCFVIWRFGKQNFYLRMFNVILLREWHSVSAFLAQTLCNCWPHLLLWDLFFQFWQFHEIVILQISLIWFET